MFPIRSLRRCLKRHPETPHGMRAGIRLSCLVLFIFCHSQSSADAALDNTRNAIQEWVNTEQLISIEKKQWREEKRSIEDILKILAAEKKELNRQVTLAKETTTRADEKRAALVAELSSYQEISSVLELRLEDFERQISLIDPYLPDILRKELSPQMARIKFISVGIAYSVSERAQTVLNILSQIAKFDRKLTLTTATRTNSQNEEIEVRVLYLGLSRAFYVNRGATVGGYGVPSESGWRWQQDNDLSETIARSMDVYEAKLSPEFVMLPMKVEK